MDKNSWTRIFRESVAIQPFTGKVLVLSSFLWNWFADHVYFFGKSFNLCRLDQVNLGEGNLSAAPMLVEELLGHIVGQASGALAFWVACWGFSLPQIPRTRPVGYSP